MSHIQPTTKNERLEVVDALRGFALFGILFANLYSFIGYNTYSPNEILQLPSADKGILFFIDWFIEGKFYSIFSILFGMGFALQYKRFNAANDSFLAYWYRRMAVLCLFGLIHMYLIWNGDILTLYAILGLCLPLFIKCTDKGLIKWIILLLSLPILLYFIVYFTAESAFWKLLIRYSNELQYDWGLTDKSLLELRTSSLPKEVAAINILKAIPRPMSYLMTGRYFHVLGLFLIGLLLSRTWISHIETKTAIPSKPYLWLGGLGILGSFIYALTKLIMGSGYELSALGIIQVISYNIGSTTFALAIAFVFVSCWSKGLRQQDL